MTRVSPPRQKPGRSEQTVCTPPEFLRAIQRRWQFAKFDVDLACTDANSVAPIGIAEELDSLAIPWEELPGKNLWLNPPFGAIRPWVEKCAAYRGPARIFVLTPASVSSRWFQQCVWGQACCVAITPKLKFVGHENQFPKDLMLSIYGAAEGQAPFDQWDWKA